MTYYCAKPEEDIHFKPERQCFGYTIAILGAISTLLLGFLFLITAIVFPFNMYYLIFLSLGAFSLAVFFILALHMPNYIGGNPGIVKLTPVMIGYGSIWLGFTLASGRTTSYYLIPAIIFAVIFFIFFGIFYGIYIKNDSDPNACCLCMKPWIYRAKFLGYPYMTGYPPVYPAPVPVPMNPSYVSHGYPPYGQAPVQGYPHHGQAPPIPQHQPYPAPMQAPMPQAYPSPAPSSHLPYNQSPVSSPQQTPEKPGLHPYSSKGKAETPISSSSFSSQVHPSSMSPQQAPPPYHPR